MLVGAQHTQNKTDALVCSFCFCFIGSIELQIGRKLLFLSDKNSQSSDGHVEDSTEIESMTHITDLNSCAGNLKTPRNIDKEKGSNEDLSSNAAESLINGNIQLPFSSLFSLPAVVFCIGGCEDEFFCSEKCAKAAWESYHSLLCSGPKSLCKDKDFLCKFIHHANETNDIFLVAAKVISSTILKASSLEQLKHKNDPKKCYTSEDCINCLLEAWEPFSMGFKRLWWDSIALPIDLGADDEIGFRNEIKELASHSLKLLKGAIFEEKYAPLFSLQVYGHVIGMFELNNLDLVVASPVEDYFIYIDELDGKEKVEAEKFTRPLLDALGDDYNVPCEGTAFFPVQSCANHSCVPNMKAFKRDEDKDGQAVLLATRPIQFGEELTISYIDEDASWEERKALLKDYGFICMCPKCIKES
ncbi:hypothetical protein KP509_03G007800 [Ceratopteris richardii]|nr:hypothetical protein KP509_03G007800 [Ceratopteris richardii]